MIICSLLALASCKADVTDNTPPVKEPETNNTAPVETNRPNATYTPTFQGQTRVPDVKIVTVYEGTILTSALRSP